MVIDQFISSGEQKWGRMCGLVMLLPHGYEGQGQEHSSARLERYLQLCAEQNMQVCVPSTPAQVYHMLRRQALRGMRRPLEWGRMCGLVMLLPHGYEGQGPEHSSARLERYLQLCAEQNMQVCVPSTTAQVYHMLRRQALRGMRRPLVVMSPKSLLRHPLAVSSLE